MYTYVASLPTDLMEGFLHPLKGTDHLLAMVAVGAVSALMRRRHLWIIPALFVICLAVGGVLGILGWVMNGAEIAIAISLILLGIFVMFNDQISPEWAYLAVIVFGFAHGNPHGTEISSVTSPLPYVAGFMVASSMAHLGGIAIVESFRHALGRVPWTRATGSLISLVGALFLSGAL